MTKSSLRSKTIQALSWNFAQTVFTRGVQFIVIIVLSRLLFPAQFGLIGMLAIFMAVAQSLLDSGFGAALVQKQEVTQLEICSIFYFSILVGLIVTALLYLLAPWIAAFYRQPLLVPIMRVLLLTIIFNSFGMIQGTILTKRINFKTQAKVGLISSTLSGIAAILMAKLGLGIWSLVFQQVFSSLLSTASLWFLSPWRPSWRFSLTALKGMFGFGSRMLLSSLLNQLFENLYFVVIGRLFTPNDLGYFTRAKTIADLPSQTLSGIVAQVIFPVFSTIQNDPVKLKEGLKTALGYLSLVVFPIMVGLGVVARPLVSIVLTERWMPCVPYLQLMCVAGLLFPLHLLNLNVLLAVGRSDLFFRLEVIKKILTIINIAITIRWGIFGLIYGMIVFSVAAYYLNSYYVGKLIRYPFKEQFRDLFAYLIVAALMGAVVFSVTFLQIDSDWLLLLAQIAAGGATYVCLCRLLRLAAFMGIWRTLNRRLFLADGRGE